MAKKTDVTSALGDVHGITLFQEGKDFGLAFQFSNTLLAKMKGVPGAEFQREDNFWKVPAASVDQLLEVVADMRDFNRLDGVQVKDVGGDKLVFFDYNKAMAQLIGPLPGAEFDKDANAWRVPANSKALVADAGATSYFDLTVNKMRGMVLEIAKAREAILGLANESAKARKLQPAIHFPAADKSYTGPILNANGHFAAQLTGVDDDKNVAYIAVHRQADLGQDVMKGDDVRIDYDEDRHVRVRTVEAFRQQQGEREKLSKLVADKMDGAKVLNASYKEGKSYSGKVVEATDHFVLHHSGRAEFTLHDRARLKGNFEVGANMDVKYDKKGLGLVNAKQKSREMPGMAR